MRKPSSSYKPSSMNCIRNMYFQLMGVEPQGKATYQLTGMGETGTARHEKIQSYLLLMQQYGMDWEYIDVEVYIQNMGLNHLKVVERKGYEVKVYNERLNISFLCDGILKHKDEYYIFEFKTETTYKEGPREQVDEAHYVQGTTYSVCLEIDKVLFLYENRDNCHKKAYLLEITDEMKYDLVISRIEECDGYVKRMIVPPKPKDLTGKLMRKTCEYCNYKAECKKAGA